MLIGHMAYRNWRHGCVAVSFSLMMSFLFSDDAASKTITTTGCQSDMCAMTQTRAVVLECAKDMSEQRNEETHLRYCDKLM